MEDVVQAHVDAFNRRDVAALMDGFAEDAVWITGTSTVRGRAELTELFAEAITGLLPKLTIQNLIAVRDRAAAQMTEEMTVDGVRLLDSIAGFYVVRDRLIVSAKIYRERSAVVE
jgi:hypothetical protein